MNKVVSGTDRLTLSALADRLIYGDAETFSANDARQLAQLLPAPSNRRFLLGPLPAFIFRGSVPRISGSGFAAGVGSVSLPQDDLSFDFDSRGRRMIRAGQWRLYRHHAAIGIEQMMAGEGEEGRAALLEFRKGEPTRLLLMVTTEVSIGPIGVGLGRFKPWKLPATPHGT